MLELTSIKNVKIEDITFTPNTLVLLKNRERDTNNGLETVVNYIEVCELKDTKELTIIQSLLRYCLAEFKVSKEFETDYKGTNIKQRRVIQPFLNTNVIFRTDSNGKISKALVSEVNFNRTALNIRDNHNICKCEPENLKAAIYQHSKAIFAQCSYISTVIKKAEDILKMFDLKEGETTKVTKKAGKKEGETTKEAA